MNKFVFSDDSLFYVNAQITQTKQDFSYYDKISESEYLAIKDHISKPKTILDLGCGLGRMSIFLNWKLKDESIRYILADSTVDQKPTKISYGWNPKNENGFYNDLKITSDFCKMNGLKNFEVCDLSKDSLKSQQNVDLVMSFMCIGFHYEIESYLDCLLKIASKKAIFVFGIRKGMYKKKTFSNIFDTEIITQNIIDVKEEILILKNIRKKDDQNKTNSR